MRNPSPRLRGLLAPSDPDGIAAWARRYLDHLTQLHRHAAAVKTRRSKLAHFHAWCIERDLMQPADITHAHMQRFQQHLFRYRKTDGKPMCINGQRAAVYGVAAFFRYLVKQGVVQSNPAVDLDLPQGTFDLREPLTLEEVERVLAIPDIETPNGLRDRTVLEVLYATGMRRTELTNLLQTDIDHSRGTVHVRLGKGKKDRFTPLGERALAWIETYERESRPLLIADAKESRLVVNQYGQPLSPDGLSWRVKDTFRKAGIVKVGACHLFRHTMATAMLDNGADIRHVQEILGHAQITSTQRYTHVSIARLQAVHAATHPAARLTRGSGPPET